tara:strand:+ start:132 stop:506 length:375 start_codon:yes stop_codon:yes gene_type:complete
VHRGGVGFALLDVFCYNIGTPTMMLVHKEKHMSIAVSWRKEEEDGTDLAGQEVTWNGQTFLILSDGRKASWCMGWGIVTVRDLTGSKKYPNTKGQEYGLSGWYFDDQGFNERKLKHEEVNCFYE